MDGVMAVPDSMSGTAGRLPGRIQSGGHRYTLQWYRHSDRYIQSRRLRFSLRTPVRDHDQRNPGRRTVICLYGSHAGTLTGCRKSAGYHGNAVRFPARWVGNIRHHCRHVTGDKHGNCRRHSSDHGPVISARHVASGLFSLCFLWHDLRVWNAGADYSTLHCSRTTGRCTFQRLPAGATVHGKIFP